jgi:hypothetical protein
MSSLFGLDQSNRLVFVSEVPRGLACQCRCVACSEPLVARQGAIREHHFAHASGRELCDVSHESLLHRYAKQVIQEAGGLAVPVNLAVAEHLGLDGVLTPSTQLQLPHIEVEHSIQDVRPDPLGHHSGAPSQSNGVLVLLRSVEVDQFARLGLAALEIDLRAFSTEGFEPEAVRAAVLHDLGSKAWLWPKPPAHPGPESEPGPDLPELAAPKPRLPEEIVTIAGRWVSLKELPSGDLALRAIRWPDIVTLVSDRRPTSCYRPRKSWNVVAHQAAVAGAAAFKSGRSQSFSRTGSMADANHLVHWQRPWMASDSVVFSGCFPSPVHQRLAKIIERMYVCDDIRALLARTHQTLLVGPRGSCGFRGNPWPASFCGWLRVAATSDFFRTRSALICSSGSIDLLG